MNGSRSPMNEIPDDLLITDRIQTSGRSSWIYTSSSDGHVAPTPTPTPPTPTAAYDAADADADAAYDAAAAYDDDDDAAYYDAAAAYYYAAAYLLKEPDMENGLKILQIPGQYGRHVTLVAWIRRVRGDEWQVLPGARTVTRSGAGRGLASLATDGPKKDYKLGSPSKGPEEIHRLTIRRSLQASVDAWTKLVPMPSGWPFGDV